MHMVSFSCVCCGQGSTDISRIVQDSVGVIRVMIQLQWHLATIYINIFVRFHCIYHIYMYISKVNHWELILKQQQNMWIIYGVYCTSRETVFTYEMCINEPWHTSDKWFSKHCLQQNTTLLTILSAGWLSTWDYQPHYRLFDWNVMNNNGVSFPRGNEDMLWQYAN